MTTKKPNHTLRRGNLEAAIWSNDGKNGAFYRVTFSRRYQSSEGIRSTSSFSREDLATLALLTGHVDSYLRDVLKVDEAAKAAEEETAGAQ